MIKYNLSGMDFLQHNPLSGFYKPSLPTDCSYPELDGMMQTAIEFNEYCRPYDEWYEKLKNGG